MFKRWMDICESIQELPGYATWASEDFGMLCVVGALLLVAEKIHNLTEGKARDGD